MRADRGGGVEVGPRPAAQRVDGIQQVELEAGQPRRGGLDEPAVFGEPARQPQDVRGRGDLDQRRDREARAQEINPPEPKPDPRRCGWHAIQDSRNVLGCRYVRYKIAS